MWSRNARPDERCALSPLEAEAADYYIDYWTNEIGFPEIVSEEEGAVLSIETTEFQTGATIVAIDAMADEDGLLFVFDAAGALQLYFHSEQSSTAHFSCAAGDVLPESEWPSEDCTGSALFGFPHDAAHASTGSASVTFADLSSGHSALPALVAQIALGALDGQSIPDTQVLDLEWTAWDEPAGGTGARVTLDGATYTATDGFFGDPIIVLAERADSIDAMCKRLE
jgi:hypothetical protein